MLLPGCFISYLGGTSALSNVAFYFIFYVLYTVIDVRISPNLCLNLISGHIYAAIQGLSYPTEAAKLMLKSIDANPKLNIVV